MTKLAEKVNPSIGKEAPPKKKITPEEFSRDNSCLGEQVLIKRVDVNDELTDGGIVKPQIARLKSNHGIVYAVGEGRMIGNAFVPFNFGPGDSVLFARAGGTDIEVDGELFILLHWKMVYVLHRRNNGKSN